MELFVAYGIILLLYGPTHLCSAGPEIIGEPPSFVIQPSDTVVHSSYFVDINDTIANLVLHCEVTGTPTPSVSWFRGGTDITGEGHLLSNGTIGLNVTEGSEATRTGVAYHCIATNIIGPENATATIRSRDANVTYAFFGGFDDNGATVTVQVAVGQPGALECFFRPSNPPPQVEWRRGGVEVSLNERVRLIDGRYLVFDEVMSSDTSDTVTYTCHVINVNISKSETSPTQYLVMGTLSDDEVEIYKSIGDLEGTVGQMLTFTFVGAFKASSGQAVDNGITVRCVGDPYLGLGDFAVDGLEYTFTVPSPNAPSGTTKITIGCALQTSLGRRGTENGTLTIVGPANITSIAARSPELVQRDLIAGGSRVVLTCSGTGIPQPTVRWFYNGSPIQSSDGVSENENQVTISTPQVINSGIYQCFFSNGIQGILADMQRTWVIEITTPRTPTITSLVLTNPLAVSDRLVGSVIVQPFNTTNVVVRVEVDSNPCPSIQWQFNGDNITSSNDGMYTFDNPCDDKNNFSPYQFNITIANLTMTTSGNYSALFKNAFSGVVHLPGLYVTNPVPVEVVSISLEIVSAPGARCLLAGNAAILTCNINGFPRPTIQFAKESVTVMPATSERINNISFDQIEITNIDRKDEGLYSCQAGSVQLTNPQTFLYCTRPVINTIKATENVVEGSPFEIECDFESIPFPDSNMVKWLKDNQMLSSEGDNIRISTSRMDNSNMGKAIVSITSSSESNNGFYTCIIENPSMSANQTIQVQIKKKDTALLSTSAIIGVAAGAAGLFLIIVLLILLLICVFLCARKSSKSVDFHPYNVDAGGDDYKDGRGNVDADSVDGNVPPEAFDPDYASLPTTRPHEPPPYKAAPGYSHGGPLEGDDLEMVKYPPQDSESFVAGYSRQPEQYRPTPDDFLSEDAQFV